MKCIHIGMFWQSLFTKIFIYVCILVYFVYIYLYFLVNVCIIYAYSIKYIFISFKIYALFVFFETGSHYIVAALELKAGCICVYTHLVHLF